MREEDEDNETVLLIEVQNEGVPMWMESIFAVVACEALVQWWFNAAPIQPLRRFLVRMTPFLYSEEQDTHLFDCRYCTSVWAAMVVVLVFSRGWHLVLFFLAIHRLSNFLHLCFSLLRDKQLDLRVARK
jgi:hypothetical protein